MLRACLHKFVLIMQTETITCHSTLLVIYEIFVSLRLTVDQIIDDSDVKSEIVEN